jgi:antitoxin (DNA-binding transcriptional repressor) of toxin-antitoxin stability system
MERIEISTASNNLSEIVKHVSRDGVCVELAEGQVPLAKIVPIDAGHSLADLDRALRDCRLSDDDAEDFASDVLSVREALEELDDPWES